MTLVGVFKIKDPTPKKDTQTDLNERDLIGAIFRLDSGNGFAIDGGVKVNPHHVILAGKGELDDDHRRRRQCSVGTRVDLRGHWGESGWGKTR